MKWKNEQTELSYYGLYLLNHLRENHFPQVEDKDFINDRAELAAETYEQARCEGKHGITFKQTLHTFLLFLRTI